MEDFNGKLQELIEERMKLAHQYDEEAAQLLAKSKQLREELCNDLQKVQEKIKPKAKKGLTVENLILAYLEKNGESSLADIKKYLVANNKKAYISTTINKLKKNGVIKNIERGIYSKMI